MFGGTKPSFGGNTTATGFGTFGSPTNTSPFGQSTFGKPATTGFSTTTPVFGAATQNTSLFGATAQPTTGLFGAPAAAPAFGAPATTQSFGFGQTGANTSLFGGNAPGTASASTGTLFGASTTTSAFGQPAKSSTFGFGATQSSGGLFGQPVATQAATTSGLFGQSAATQPATGLFGSSPGFSGATSGTVIKFNPVTGSDMMVKSGQSTSINTKHHCITCMKEYEGKSLEELRLEDYMANRKGPQAGGLATASPFGMGQPQTGGLFGQQNTAAPATGGLFGQQENKSLFGATNPTMGGFGNTTPAFGATSQAGTSTLFGAKPVTGFGAQPASTTTSAFSFNTNTFGANTQAKPFGSTTPQTSLFGQPATSTFGATTNTGFGVFGSPATQSTGLFGAKQTSPFNMPAATNTGFGAFGQTATTTTATTSLFGAKPATTGFGATTAGFGTPATSTGFGGFGQTTGTNSLFNNFNKPANTSTFGFGATTGNTTLGSGLTLGGTTGSLFGGNTGAKPGGLFGSTNTTGTGLFGTTGTGAFGTNTGLTNTALGNTSLGLQPSTQANVPIHQQMMLLSQPFGDSPLFKNLAPASGKVDELLKPTNPAAQKAVLDSAKYKLSSPRDVKIKIKPLSLSTNPKKALFDGLEESDRSVEEAFTLKPNAKRLVLKPKLQLTNSIENVENSQKIESPKNPDVTEVNSSPSVGKSPGILSNDKGVKNDNRRVSWLNTSTLNRERIRKNSIEQDTVTDNTISEFTTADPSPKEFRQSQNSSGNFSFDQQGTNNESFERKNLNYKAKASYKEAEKENLSNSSGSNTSVELQATGNVAHYPTGITLTRSGYYTIPTLDKLAEYMTEDNQCMVPNFTIGREGYGNVYFNDSFDVANLNLDEIVHFRHKEVVIYPDDDNKPPIGQGLNRKAQVTLDRVWPHDKTKHETITDPEILKQIDYEGKLRRVCAKHDTRFLEYRPQTGSWVFKVEHFSKYGLSDSEDEEDISNIAKKTIKPVSNKIATDHVINKPAQKSKIKENGLKFNKSYDETPKGLGGTFTNGDINGTPNGYDHSDKSMSDHLLKYPGIYAEAEDNGMQTSWLNYNSENRNEVRSPTSDVAKESGTNSHKLQLMKASFFIDDDDEIKSTVDPMDTYGRNTPDQTVPRGPVMRSHFNIEKESLCNLQVPEMMQILPTETEAITMDVCQGPKSEAPIIKPTTVILQYNQHTLPYQSSICNRLNCGYLADASVFNGRRFKNGWGPNNTLLSLSTNTLASSLAPESGFENLHSYLEGRKNNDRSSTVLQALKIGKVDESHFKDIVIPHLEVQLQYTKIETKSTDDHCPHASTNVRVHESHYETAKALSENFGDRSDQCQYNAQVWELVKALWGEMETLEGIEKSSHLSVMCRRKAFSEWLEKWSALENMTNNIDNKDSSSELHLYTILDLLSQHKVLEACEIAQKNGDYYLSMLLSQISSGPVVRELMKQQLVSWKDVDADLFISPLRLRVFLLVAGVTLFESSHGLINIFNGLDWKRALAVHLWYICLPTASITDSLLLYENAFNSDNSDLSSGPYACPPNPPYECYYKVGDEKRQIHDLCFHLLKLYSCHSHPLESLLNPATHTADAIDYRLSWFLQQSLHAIGYGHNSELSQCMVHSSFASQLESNGLWHWAVFVLMHIESAERRAHTISQVLNRHVSLSKQKEYIQKEEFLLNELNIPHRWLYSAKALYAGCLSQFREQAECFISGQMWNEAHAVIMQHLAPDDFINGDMQSLRQLLAPLVKPEISCCISGWTVQGQLLWDFLELESMVQPMLCNEHENMGYHLEKLQPRMSSLCSRVNLFPCPTSKHTLCQSELSKKIINIVRGITMQADNNDMRTIIKIIDQLPMPEDYAQHELRLLIDNIPVNINQMS